MKSGNEQGEFKKMISEKLRLQVMGYLILMQNKHKNIHFEGELQNDLTTDELNLSHKTFLFKLR